MEDVVSAFRELANSLEARGALLLNSGKDVLM